MKHILTKHRERIAALNLEGDSAFKYDSKRWSKLHSEAKSAVREFEDDKITRQMVVDSYVAYYDGNADYLKPFVMTMIWGFADTGYGTHRTNKYLETAENKNWIKEGIDLMGEAKSKEAFKTFLKISGLNMSYISKLLYFGTRAKGMEEYALIFDIRVARSLARLYAPNEVADLLEIFPSVNYKIYEKYNTLLHKWAREINVDAEQIELFLFDGKFETAIEKTIPIEVSKTNDSPIECLPLNDSRKRFMLGVKGQASLLAVGLNPSIANENGLDPTSENIQAIAEKGNCDGWYLFNLYPERTSNPKNLPKKCNEELGERNIQFIEDFLRENNNISKVLFCWGNDVDTRTYLRDYANRITELIQNHQIDTYCIGETKKRNPFHPSRQAVNIFLGGISNVKLLPYAVR